MPIHSPRNESGMTVNDYKETACVTAGHLEDVEMEQEPILQPPQDSENLLGRVLAGNTDLGQPSPKIHSPGLIRRGAGYINEPVRRLRRFDVPQGKKSFSRGRRRPGI